MGQPGNPDTAARYVRYWPAIELAYVNDDAAVPSVTRRSMRLVLSISCATRCNVDKADQHTIRTALLFNATGKTGLAEPEVRPRSLAAATVLLRHDRALACKIIVRPNRGSMPRPIELSKILARIILRAGVRNE